MYTDKDNGKRYIGQSVNIARRWSAHIYQKECIDFDLVLREKGITHFTFEVLEECTVDKLDEREQYWINYYNSYDNGYNKTEGGKEKFNNTRASEDQAKYIIQLLEQTSLTQDEIALKTNTSRDIVNHINRCSTWKHLHNYKKNIRKEYKLTNN